jgi:hypothetical protein
MEEEHNQIGDVAHIHTQRAEVKEKMRLLEQDIERLHVRQFFYSTYHCLKHTRFGTTFLG